MSVEGTRNLGTRESNSLHASGSMPFEDFFRLNVVRLVRSLYLLTGDLEEAEDLAQDAFIKVLDRWLRVSEMESPGGYLLRTAFHEHLKRVRRRRLLRYFKMPEPLDPTIAIDDRLALMHALEGLSIKQRQAIVLIDYVGVSSEEAGRMLSLQPSSVRSTVMRARRALALELGASDDAPEDSAY